MYEATIHYMVCRAEVMLLCMHIHTCGYGLNLARVEHTDVADESLKEGGI